MLVDDYVIANREELIQVVRQPVPVSDKPLPVTDRPREESVLQMPCVLFDSQTGSYRMYYWAVAGDHLTYTCYATSTDGICWEKPTLNLYVGPNGSKANNIVLRGEGRVARTHYVVLNSDQSDPDRLFWVLYIDNVPRLTEFAASSPDGLHWNTEARIGDLCHVKAGDVTANPSFFLIEQQWSRDP